MNTPTFDVWLLRESEAGQFNSPAQLEAENLSGIKAIVPGTVAQALEANNLWHINIHKDFDLSDWWYSTTFNFTGDSKEYLKLNFDGLATLCDIWLNGNLIHQSKNMFLATKLDISTIVQPKNKLHLCFRSLTTNLKSKRPRPRWKTKLVSHQNLRWIRTTLLGKIPGWSPPVSPVGPWKPISFSQSYTPQNIKLSTSLNETLGVVDIGIELLAEKQDINRITIRIGELESELTLVPTKNGIRAFGSFILDNVKLWWPHTHGDPYLYPVELEITSVISTTVHQLPRIGFKKVLVDQTDGQFTLYINDRRIFCRGACWTINDMLSLVGEENHLRSTLTLMKQAGANMIRIGGTMTYEQDLFYELCDELGILVWQDFMFANMDYPIDDDLFFESVRNEITHQLSRFMSHPSISIYCGNSEVLQQASMTGLSIDKEIDPLFDVLIPRLCSEIHKNIPYVASTPSGGALPFHTNKGLSHYYGVGAYLQSPKEIRNHDVKFSPEALGFANIPAEKLRTKMFDGNSPVTHDPRWKQRTPRDSGAGWDFEDIRDFYLQLLYSINPTQLRYADPTRYFKLSEIVTGEIMRQAYSEWRSLNSCCSGALVWFLKDFWPGAGWGILDSEATPKACYYYLKRIWQPINLTITDESINGLDIHIINESPEPLEAKLTMSIFNNGHISIAVACIDVELAAYTQSILKADSLLGHFYDLTYSYRFGPSKHNVISFELTKFEEVLCHEFYFPEASLPDLVDQSCVKVKAISIDENDILLEINSTKLLYAVSIEVDGYLPRDNFFHITPNSIKRVVLTLVDKLPKRFKCYLSAVNLNSDIRVEK